MESLMLCFASAIWETQIRETFGDGSKYGVHISYSSIEDIPLGTAGALKNAESLLGNIFFVMYGDSYLFLDFQKVHVIFYVAEQTWACHCL